MPSALVGRDRELGVLLGCLDEASAAARTWSSAWASPGIGKTRLVEELTRRPGHGRPDRVGAEPRRTARRRTGRGGRCCGHWGRGAGCGGRRGRCWPARGDEPSLEERVRRFDEVGPARARGREEPPAARRPRRPGRRGRAVAAAGAVPRAHRTRRPSPCWSAAATPPAPSPALPRSPTPPRSSCVAWSGPPSASRSPPSSGGRPATPSWLRCTTPRRATRSSWASSPVSWPTGPPLSGACPGRCSTRSASGSARLSPDCAASLRAAALLGTGSRYPSSPR